MAQKSFTMWPSTNSSTASTVSFLTAADKRFIVILLASDDNNKNCGIETHFFHRRVCFDARHLLATVLTHGGTHQGALLPQKEGINF